MTQAGYRSVRCTIEQPGLLRTTSRVPWRTHADELRAASPRDTITGLASGGHLAVAPC